MSMMATILDVRGLTVELPTTSGWIRPVDNVSFTLNEGETLGIVGRVRLGQDDVVAGFDGAGTAQGHGTPARRGWPARAASRIFWRHRQTNCPGARPTDQHDFSGADDRAGSAVPDRRSDHRDHSAAKCRRKNPVARLQSLRTHRVGIPDAAGRAGPIRTSSREACDSGS